MSNLEQFPINKVPENSNETIKEETKEKVESEPKQESENTEVEDLDADEVFTENVNKVNKSSDKKKSWLRNQFNNAVTAVAVAASLGHVSDAVSGSAEKEFTSDAKNKTEQMVSEENTVEMQGQKAKIIKPFEVLSEADWKSVTDTAGYVSLQGLADLICRRVPGTYYIDEDNKNSYNKILQYATQHRIIGDHQIFSFSNSNSPLGPEFGMVSKGRDNTGEIGNSVWNVEDMPDKLIYSWFETNKSTVEMVFAGR